MKWKAEYFEPIKIEELTIDPEKCEHEFEEWNNRSGWLPMLICKKCHLAKENA